MKETDLEVNQKIENSLIKIKEFMQYMYHEYNGKASHITEDFRKRKLILNVIAGEYERPDGWIFCVEGTPVRGKLYISNTYENHCYCKNGATWRPLRNKFKYIDLCVVISEWKKYTEELSHREWKTKNET